MSGFLHPRSLLLTLSFLLSVAGLRAADKPKLPDVPLISPVVRQLVQDGDYAAAIGAIDEAIAVDDSGRDRLLHLKGRVLHWDRQFEAAVAAFATLIDEYPESVWRRRAQFDMGLALVGKGDFRRADQLYHRAATALLAEDRKHELAEICLEFADTFFGPADDDREPEYRQEQQGYDLAADDDGPAPDFGRAQRFYERALEMGVKPARRAEVELRVARCLEENTVTKGVKAYETFIAGHADSPQAIEARYRLGQCYLAKDEFKLARRAWQDLLAAHPDAPSERIAEARFDLSRTWGIPEPSSDADMQLGIAALESFLQHHPTHRLAGLAHLDIARSLMVRGRQGDAAKRFELLLGDARYQDPQQSARAQSLLGQAYREQDQFTKALAAWQQYLTDYPTDSGWSEVQQNVVDAQYAMGLERFQAKDYDAARRVLTQFMSKYPLDARVPGIFVLLGRMDYQEKKFAAAITAWRRVVSKYPNTDESEYSHYMIGTVLEQEMGDPQAAMKAYEEITWGAYDAEARLAIARLTDKALKIATERVFRSDETPQLRLTTRNLESVSVRVYRVDLPSYFRKVHAMDRIEQLDIALIDPTDSFEFQITDYAPHLELERTIDVPLPDGATCGAVAVTVASETDEATTLILQSDLDIITKATVDGVFVFAQNMVSGKPWPAVQLLISNGQQIVAEGVTGDDGVYHATGKDNVKSGDVRVLAVADGHVNSSERLVIPAAMSEGLSDRGYIFTERPVYGANQAVKVRGCLRQIAAGDQTIQSGKKVTLQVVDPHDRTIWNEEVVLNDFGSFHASFLLPPCAAPGAYRIRVGDGKNLQYHSSFRVQEYELQPIRLVIESPRNVVYRGETIQGAIRAEHYDGTPLAACEIVYQLADDRQHTAVTDGDGRIAFELQTRDYAKSQTLPLIATLAVGGVQATSNFYLATQGFSIDLRTSRDVFIVGESFVATVRATDAAGKPASRTLSLKVLKLTTINGKVGEHLVHEQTVETSASEGLARPTIQLDEGGPYRLRVEGIDRLGNPVSAEHVVSISDDTDTVALRVLADQHRCRVGDKAEVTLHWRGAPTLALITLEAAGVLDYQLVPLETGGNKLAVLMHPRYAPNFDLVANVMTDPRTLNKRDNADGRTTTIRFHEASSPFIVERELSVRVTVRRQDGTDQPLQPDDEVHITLRTTDSQGTPVPAEVSLAMIDRAVLEQFPTAAAKIQEFFRRTIQESTVCTDSSIDFAYNPVATPINPRLLTERQRDELARRERASLGRGMGGMGGGFAGMGMGGGMGGYGGYPGADGEITQRGWGDDGSDFRSLIEVMERETGDSVRNVAFPGAFPSLSVNSLLAKMQEETDHEPTMAGPNRNVDFSDATGYWNPSIMTGPDGNATVSLTVPVGARAWTLVAKGVTQSTLVGQTTIDVVSKPKDLFGELKLPSAFTEGDVAQITAFVHDASKAVGNVSVSLSTEIGGRRVQETKQVSLNGSGICEVQFDVTLQRPELAPAADAQATPANRVSFQLTVGQGELQDVVERTVPLRPYGMTVYATSGGVAAADATARIRSATDMVGDRLTLQIRVSPTIQRSLVDVIAADPIDNLREVRSMRALPGRTASDLMAALGLQDLLAADPNRVEMSSHDIDQLIRNTIGHLVSSQNSDGGWGWAAAGTASDRQTSARTLWALALARRADRAVPDTCFEAALKYAEGQIAATENRDFENKAILLHALATAGKGEFFLANRLVRERESLSPSALLYLALAFAEMDRKETARELLAGVTAEQLEGRWNAASSVVGRPARSHGPVALRALHLLAILGASAQGAAAPQAATTDELAQWLLAHRTDNRWSPDEATGPATLALCVWAGGNQSASDPYRLAIRVNNALVRTLEMDDRATTQVIDVPRRHLVQGQQEIDFQLQGRGRYTYQVDLGGYVPAQQLSSTTKEWLVRRTYEPAPLVVDGREITRGFDIVTGTTGRFRNPLTQLPVGRRGLVELRYWRAVAENQLALPEEYLIVTEPIPSGTHVVPRSVRGALDHYEIDGGSITFFIGQRWKPGIINYELRGTLPGQYRAAPTIAWDAYREDQMAISTVGNLTVLPAGIESADPYRLTPQELFQLGELAIQRRDMAEAEQHLAKLLADWNLTANTYRQVVGMLLEIQLALGNSAETIRYFEIIQERWPDERIALDDGMKIAAAYHQLGEFERSYLGFRAIVESNFKQESGMAGFLESQHAFLAAVGLMERLLDEYPSESYTATAQYALAQQVFAKSATVDDDAELVEAGVNRVELVTHAWRLLQTFLTNHAEDPAADQVAFSAANALLDLEQFTEAAAACQRYVRRYPDSKLLGSLWYIIGYCQFADGQHELAAGALQRVVDLAVDAAGTDEREENSNRWAALYILGQIYHSLGRPAEAIAYYRQVEERFPDAKKSIDYFLRKAIRFDEVTTVRPGQSVEVELTYRNITACNVRVYRIDLMKFALLNQDLGSIAQVNLAGIEPQQAKTFALGDGQDYRDRTYRLRLDVDAEGAYLIVCQGDDSYASGLMLITPLEIEVQYDASDEEARVIVRDIVADGYVKDAEVRVLGGWDADLVSGQTDRRGVFVADAVPGDPAVIAQAGPGRYAYRRGEPAGAMLPPGIALQLQMAGPLGGAMGGDRSPSAGVPLSPNADRAAELRIGAALNMLTAVDFDDTPLEDVAKFLAKQHGIPIMIDSRALDDVGIGTDVPVTIQTRGISLRAALRLILKELDLTYVIRDECLLISTPEEAESQLVTMIYPVRDLVRFQDSDGQGWPDFDTLIDTITSTVAPTAWDCVGGPGSIEGMSYQNSDVLVLSQTLEVHEQIEGLLGQLRSIIGNDDGEGGGDSELPVRERPTWDEGGSPGMGDGFGGFGGMGGMGGGMGGGPFGGASSAAKRAPGKRNELLRGLHDTHQNLQGREIKKLQNMYDQGGMGGGVGAGGMF